MTSFDWSKAPLWANSVVMQTNTDLGTDTYHWLGVEYTTPVNTSGGYDLDKIFRRERILAQRYPVYIVEYGQPKTLKTSSTGSNTYTEDKTTVEWLAEAAKKANMGVTFCEDGQVIVFCVETEDQTNVTLSDAISILKAKITYLEEIDKYDWG